MTIFDDMIVDILCNKKLNPVVTEVFIREIKLHVSLAFFTQSYFAFSKTNRQIQHAILLWKLQTEQNFNKLHLTIHQILTFKTLWIFIKSVLRNSILFWLLILILHQIVLHVSEWNLLENIKKVSHDNWW